MTAQSKTTLKGYFNLGDIPSESNFIDLIDSFALEASPTLTGTPTVVGTLTVGAGALDQRIKISTPYLNNMGIGVRALDQIDGICVNNTAVGYDAMASGVIAGNSNTAIGFDALWYHLSGAEDTAVGAMAGFNNVSGNQNTMIGSSAGKGALNQSNTRNTFIGCNNGYSVTTGTINTFLGYATGFNHTSGSYNTCIGGLAGTGLTTADQNVFIGYAAGYYETGAFKLIIDNAPRNNEADQRAKALIYGVFHAAVASQSLAFNAGSMGFFGHAAAAQPTKAGHNNWAALADVVAALVAIGIFDTA